VNVDVAQLQHLPLFRNLAAESLRPLFEAFVLRRLAKGDVLFRAGETSRVFQVLTDGALTLHEPGEPPIELGPVSLVGELGAISGLPRNATATASSDVTVLEIPSADLTRWLTENAAVGVVFFRNLVDVVADKVRRDKVRADEMKSNLIRTQKSMKELRDIVLSAEETTLSQPLCDKLDELIEKNRRAHYRVAPTSTHPATLRLGSRTLQIVELSEGFLKIESEPTIEQGTEVSGVLAIPQQELPVSGKVERKGTDGAVLRLDLLIDEYKSVLSAYMTELQMLDFVV
jgi:CRP-like cAMP-binding protein